MDPKPKKKRGGKQPGAGRPVTIAAVGTVRVRVGIEHAAAIDVLRERWGYKETSDVVRRAILEAAGEPKQSRGKWLRGLIPCLPKRKK